MRVAAVVYGEASGIVRRTIVADSLERLAGHYGPGESIVIVQADEVLVKGVPDLAAAIEKVRAKTGKDATPVRVGILAADGTPAGTCLADLSLDVPPDGKTLVPIQPKRYALFNKAGSKDKAGKTLASDVVVDVLMADPRFDTVPADAVEDAVSVKGDKPVKGGKS